MKRLAMLSICWSLAIGVTLHAADDETGFVKKVFKDKGADFKYMVYVPKDYTGAKKVPVILFLHDAGAIGSDGQKQAQVGLGNAIRDMKEEFSFIVVFPQAQKKSWSANSTDGMRALAILEQVERDYKTDKKRVYLTGMSMGGSGTWSLAAAHPERWTAIAPISGAGDVKSAETIKGIPCWCFHREPDKAAKVNRSREMIKALKDAGGNPNYDEYPKGGQNAWTRAYGNHRLYTWFLLQSIE